MRETDKKIVRWHTIWLLATGLISLLPYVFWGRAAAILVIAVVFGIALMVLFLGNAMILSKSGGSNNTASEDNRGGVARVRETVQKICGSREFFQPTIREKEYEKIAKKVGIPSILLVVSSHVFEWKTGTDIAISIYLVGLVFLGALFWRMLRLCRVYELGFQSRMIATWMVAS